MMQVLCFDLKRLRLKKEERGEIHSLLQYFEGRGLIVKTTSPWNIQKEVIYLIVHAGALNALDCLENGVRILGGER